MKSPPQRESAACRRVEIFFSNKAGPSVDTSIKGEAGVAPPPVCKIEVKAVLEGFSSIKEQVPPREGTHPLHLHVSGSSGRGPASCLGPSKLTCREADRVCLPPSGSISGTAAGLTVEWIPLCSLSGPSLPCPAVRPATSWDAPLCPKLPGTHSASQGVS